MDVDTPPDIIDVDEDDDFTYDEDVIPYNLPDSDDEVLANDDDDDDVAVVYSNVAVVARGHGGGDDPSPPQRLIHTSCRGTGGRKPDRGGRRDGRLGTRGEIVMEFPMYYPSWHKIEEANKAGVLGKLMMESSETQEYPSLIQTFFNTHTVGTEFRQDKEEMIQLKDLGSNTPTGVPYTEDQIMAMVRKGKQREHIPGVGRVLAGQGRDAISINEPRCTHTHVDVNEVKEDNKRLRKELAMLRTVRSDDRMSQLLTQLESQHEVGGGSGSDGGEDDDLGVYEDGGGDEDADGDKESQLLNGRWRHVAGESGTCRRGFLDEEPAILNVTPALVTNCTSIATIPIETLAKVTTSLTVPTARPDTVTAGLTKVTRLASDPITIPTGPHSTTPVHSGILNVINTGSISYINVVSNEPVMNEVPSSYATKLSSSSSTKAHLWKLEANGPNEAEYDVWLPLTSVHEPNDARLIYDLHVFGIMGRSSYARVLIEINACNNFSDNLVMVVPNLEGNGFTKETIRIEYEWKPPSCSTCLIYGHLLVDCSKAAPQTNGEHHG
nr:hypothetical protein [Tanacetum cinerariifolium]